MKLNSLLISLTPIPFWQPLIYVSVSLVIFFYIPNVKEII